MGLKRRFNGTQIIGDLCERDVRVNAGQGRHCKGRRPFFKKHCTSSLLGSEIPFLDN
jgi:hypothetical protein